MRAASSSAMRRSSSVVGRFSVVKSSPGRSRAGRSCKAKISAPPMPIAVMTARTLQDMIPDKLVGDTSYGSAVILGWLVDERGIAPHIQVWDKPKRTDGTFSRKDFVYDPAADSYTCPGKKELRTYRRNSSQPRKPNGGKDGFTRYRASKHDCDSYTLKPQCCPGDPGRRVMRSVHEAARDVARDIRKTDAYMTSFIQRWKVEMLFAHLKRYIGLPMMRFRGPKGAYEQFQLAAQNLRKLAKPVPQSEPTG